MLTNQEIADLIVSTIYTNSSAEIEGNEVQTALLNVLNSAYKSVKRYVPLGRTLTIEKEQEVQFAQNLYNKGTIVINTDVDADFGYGLDVPVHGILKIGSTLVNEGTIINNGLIIIG